MRYYNILLFVFSLTILSCNDNVDTLNSEINALALSDTRNEIPIIPKEEYKQVTERKLIKEGFIEFETKDIHATRNQILSAKDKYKAYISNENEYKSNSRISNTINLRIPSEHFDAFLSESTSGVTEFDRKDIITKDVTDEFLDKQSRINNKKALEQRYIKLLDKAKEIKDILEIERQINKLRTDIERMEGRLILLQNKVSYSTLTINFYTITKTENSVTEKFKDGLISGWDNLIFFLISLVYLWPFLIIILIIILFVKWYRKRNRNKK